MKAARYYIYALLSCIAFFVGMYLFQVLMFARAKIWLERAAPIPLYQRLLYSLAMFWSTTWWLFILPVLLLSLLIAGVTHILKKPA